MERRDHELEEMLTDVAMAEEREFATLDADLAEANEALECSLIDLTMAEDGAFTTSACTPRN